MDKNSIIGLVLIAGILFAFAYLNSPDESEVKNKAKSETESVSDSSKVAEIEEESPSDTASSTEVEVSDTIQGDVASVEEGFPILGDTAYIENDTTYVFIAYGDTNATDSASYYQLVEKEKEQAERGQLEAIYGQFSKSAAGDEECHILENDNIKVTLCNKGGMVKRVELKKYLTYDDYAAGKSKDEASLVLVDSNNSYGFNVIALNKDGRNTAFNTSDIYFDVVTSSTDSIVYRLQTDDGVGHMDFVYKLTDNYGLDYDIRLNNLNSTVERLSSFRWKSKARHVEKSRSQEDMVAGVFYQFTGEGRDYISETSDGSTEVEASPDWIAFKQQFFSAALITQGVFGPGGKMGHELHETGPYIKTYYTELTSVDVESLSQSTLDLQWYFGPNDYHVLETYELGMEDIVNLGPSIFGWINENFFLGIFDWMTGFGWSMGLIILLLTIFVRLIITPLVFRNYRSSAKMRVLKPEMDEIAQKFPDQKDSMKRQQAQMALYRSTGVNPLAGCVPMLIQMPILFAMFRFIPSALELRQASFLWADDLSSFDVIASLPFDIPWYGDHVSLFTLLMAGSTLAYTVLNSGQMTQSNPNMPNMKFIMYLFPIMMIFFFNNYASGLSYYYLLSNLMSMGIMFAIKKYFIDEEKLRAQIELNKKKPKKKSKFQERLQEMQRQNQARRDQKGKKR